MKSWPMVRCASRHLKVPLGTLRVPIGTHHHQGSLIMFCVFGHFSDPFFTLFNTQKDLFIKLGHSNMSCPFVKKVTYITIFKRRKKKLIKSRFLKVIYAHLLNQRHSAMPYPLFLEQVKITHSSQKKNLIIIIIIILLKNERSSCTSL